MKGTCVFSIGFVLLFAILLSSCGGVKHSELLMLDKVQNEISSLDSIPALVIRTDDILSIKVASRTPETVRAFNQGPEATGSAGERALGVMNGYRVDEDGLIFLPFLGAMEASGLTLVEFRQLLTDQLIKFIPDVSVQVRFLNFRVTLLGEVSRPNTYVIPNERLTILEAIGMAGDFTPYARRDAVLVIRERSDVREFVRVNTQDISVFESSCFYLKPNDIIYVEPVKAKQYATRGDFFDRYSRTLTVFVSLGTFLIGALLIKP